MDHSGWYFLNAKAHRVPKGSNRTLCGRYIAPDFLDKSVSDLGDSLKCKKCVEILVVKCRYRGCVNYHSNAKVYCTNACSIDAYDSSYIRRV